MFQPTIRSIAFRGAALLLAVGGSAGIASAAASTPSTAVTTTTSTAQSKHVTKPALVTLRKQVRHDERQALLTALNLTPKQLHQDRRAGQSVAAIAQAQNVPLSTVSTALTATAQTDLDKAVAAGTLTSKREQRLLSRLQTQLPKRLNATPKAHLSKHAKGTSTTITTTSTKAN